MKKLLFERSLNYLITSFIWVCSHILIYRLTQYCDQDLEVSTLLVLWATSILIHLYTAKHFLFRMLDIYVGMYDTEARS